MLTSSAVSLAEPVQCHYASLALAGIALIQTLDGLLPNPGDGVTLFAPSNTGVEDLLASSGPVLINALRTHFAEGQARVGWS
jgi:hypothetical protein